MNRILSAAFFASLSLVAIDAAGQNTDVVTAPPQITYSESASYSPRVFPEAKDKKQEDKPKSEPISPSGAGAAKKETLTIPVGVFANNAKAKIAIEASDFRVFVDDTEGEVVSVDTRNEPLNVILLIDTSPSADVQLETVKALVRRIVEKLAPEDSVMIAAFSNDLRTLADPTSDRSRIYKGIERLKIGNGTSLYDSLAEIFGKKLSHISGPKLLMIVTDGVDTTSTKADYKASLVNAEKSDTTIFPVYFDTYQRNTERLSKLPATVNIPLTLPPPGGRAPIISSGDLPLITLPRTTKGTRLAEYEQGRFYLNDLIRLSGGRPVRGDELAPGKMESLDSIPSEMKARYYVTFRLPTGGKPGDRHRIRVRIHKPDLTILAKGSYIEQ
jgi:VWFA-related protein